MVKLLLITRRLFMNEYTRIFKYSSTFCASFLCTDFLNFNRHDVIDQKKLNNPTKF